MVDGGERILHGLFCLECMRVVVWSPWWKDLVVDVGQLVSQVSIHGGALFVVVYPPCMKIVV